MWRAKLRVSPATQQLPFYGDHIEICGRLSNGRMRLHFSDLEIASK
jgi:hypothetical protein